MTCMRKISLIDRITNAILESPLCHHDDLQDDALQEAAIATLKGQSPVKAIRKHLRYELRWQVKYAERVTLEEPGAGGRVLKRF